MWRDVDPIIKGKYQQESETLREKFEIEKVAYEKRNGPIFRKRRPIPQVRFEGKVNDMPHSKKDKYSAWDRTSLLLTNREH